MGEEGKIFSDGQRNVIYNEMLKPIKVKISEIILYDTEAAMRFLQKYNDILKCTDEKDILAKVADLEFDISGYEQNAGSQKSFEYKSQSIIQQIKDMQIDGDRLSLEDFENEFNRLKQTYQEAFQKYSFQDRDAIEQQLYALYGKVMVRRAREGVIDEGEVSKEDIAGLTIFMNNEIGRLSQNTNPQVQNVIERIKFKLMDGKNAFQGDEIWKLLSYAQEQKNVEPNQSLVESKQPQVTALAVVKEKKGLASRIKKAFQKEPQLPLQVEDLSKITLDWLAQYIPKDMLAKIERGRLQEECKNPESKYLPDSKTVIYDFVAGKHLYSNEKLSYNKYEEEYGYEYEDELGNKQKIEVSVGSYTYIHMMRLIPTYLDETNRYRMTQQMKLGSSNEVFTMLRYAMFLDDIFGTNFANELACEYGNFIQNSKKEILFKRENHYYTNKDIAKKSKLFKNLLKSYTSMAKECKKTESSFRANENANRRAFYEKSKFREEVKQLPDNQSYNTVRKDIQEGTKEQLDQGFFQDK